MYSCTIMYIIKQTFLKHTIKVNGKVNPSIFVTSESEPYNPLEHMHPTWETPLFDSMVEINVRETSLCRKPSVSQVQ